MRLKQLILLAVTSAVPMLIQAGVDYRYPAPSGMHPAWYQQMAPAPQWRPRGYYQPRIPAAYMARPMPRPVYQAPQMNNKLQQKQWPAPKGFYRPLPPQQSMQQRNRQMQQAMQQRNRQMPQAMQQRNMQMQQAMQQRRMPMPQAMQQRRMPMPQAMQQRNRQMQQAMQQRRMPMPQAMQQRRMPMPQAMQQRNRQMQQAMQQRNRQMQQAMQQRRMPMPQAMQQRNMQMQQAMQQRNRQMQQAMQQRNRQMQQAMQQRYRQMAPWQRGAYGMNRYNRYPAPAVRQPMMWQPRMNQAMPYYVPAPRYVAPTNFRHQAYRPPYSVNPWRQHSVQAFRPNNAWRQQPPVYRAPARQPVQPWRYSYQQNRLSMYGPVTRLSYLR